jgi:hypothetical protein
MPPHEHLHSRHLRGPAHPHPHTCFYNHERDADIAEAARGLHAISEQLPSRHVTLETVAIDLPEVVHLEIEHFERERHAHAYVLRADLSWNRPSHNPPPPPHRRIFMYAGDVSLLEAQTILSGLAGQLDGGTELTFENNVLEMPGTLRLAERHEVGPLGDYVLKWELTWGESGHSCAHRPIAALITT